jgi:UDPglucose--hexose-1-phosphate uridylyltransferase
MPEIRQNIVTREWVIIATERARRPEDFAKKEPTKKVLPEFSPSCPFCPGNEDQTPPEVFRLEEKESWLIRVIPNKFAALSRQGICERKANGIKRSVSGVGIHDVIIKTPFHNLTTALLPETHVEKILQAYKRRYLEVDEDSRVEQVILFKNHGESAGTSLEHSHSQLVGTPLTPYQVRNRLEEAARYFDDTGECVFCRTLQDERQDQVRIIAENPHFLAFIPYAALSPFHTWIFPKNHQASFGELQDEEIPDLARVLKLVLAKLYYGLENPDFNYVIRSVPYKEKAVEYYHWYISIVPRLTKAAGFEFGSGMYINTTFPEESAAFLRSVQLPHLETGFNT